ncbi:hypothetical protein C7M84_008270 [Penaeus vannamei]|uniref:Uncharacterized protein n=1 Tax=Penaeus vannamei TaxID=6689 RepID=A0A3R7QNU0_PENVA|nr:hypothetical protein C7M84_008270 [Penaeus vannamei]
MKDALLERDLGRARLLSEKRNEEDFQAVLVEACLVGREHFISCGETKADRSELIKDVLEAYTHLMDRVFMAAKKGKYRTEVDPLLRRYELPGSVRDEEGKSILHHIASVRTDDQRPMWTHVNIEHFMMTYNCIPNAVDYQGRTCLHLLAESAITSDKSVTWGEEEFTVTESWVCLGKLLLSLGCDPRRADNADRLPAHIARMNGNLRLFDVLSKKCEELRKDEQSTETKLVFDQILEAVYENNLQSLKKQCSLCTHLLPLESKIDPLTEAVRRGHLEAAMMLVAAGAPLCGLPLISVTPLHAAHSLPQLPIIIPVVLRKEYVNRLRYEAGSIQVISESKDEVKQKIETLARGVKSIGDKAMWRFAELRDGGKEARELLCKAADLGLSLTCQMLALEGVNIHPLPREPHPVQQAFDKKQMPTMRVLFRDLHMSLFSIFDKVDNNSPLYTAIESLEFQQFEHLCEKMKNTSPRNSFIQQLKSAYNGDHKGELDNTVLSYIASQSHHPAVDFLKEIDLVYLASCKEDDWTFILTEVQNQIFSTLRGDQQLVYMACKLIINFLYSCWWFPREHSRRHCHNWHFFSVGLVTLPYRVLMSLFLEEVASAPPEAWEPAMFLDRIISTFKRATDEEEKGRLPRKEIRLLLDPTNTVQKPVNKLICAILEFLENVK